MAQMIEQKNFTMSHNIDWRYVFRHVNKCYQLTIHLSLFKSTQGSSIKLAENTQSSGMYCSLIHNLSECFLVYTQLHQEKHAETIPSPKVTALFANFIQKDTTMYWPINVALSKFPRPLSTVSQQYQAQWKLWCVKPGKREETYRPCTYRLKILNLYLQ